MAVSVWSAFSLLGAVSVKSAKCAGIAKFDTNVNCLQIGGDRGSDCIIIVTSDGVAT